MQTEPINGFQIENGDTILVGDQTYVIKGDPVDEGDFLLFDTVDDDGAITQLPFGPFDVVMLVTSFDEDEPFVDVDIEDEVG